MNLEQEAKTQNPKKKKADWPLRIAVTIASIFSVLVIIGLMIEAGFLVDVKVVEGRKMHEADKKLLIESNVIISEDKIVYFYSEGLVSVDEGGSVLTEEVVISYLKVGEEVEVYELPFDKITNVKLIHKGSFIEDSIYRVYGSSEEDWLELYLSVEEKGDEKFIAALNERVKRAHKE